MRADFANLSRAAPPRLVRRAAPIMIHALARRVGRLPATALPAFAVGCLTTAWHLALVACSPVGDETRDRPLPYFGAPESQAPRPHFSFFVTSQAGLFGLGAGLHSPAPDPVEGFGGDLGGLAGADEICTLLARQSNPGDTKVWRAFLSSSGLFSAPREDAIDRIGPGPWYDFNGRTLATSLEGLMPAVAREGRPQGAEPQLALMFTSENGERARDRDTVDNHDILTGSGPDGRLFDDQAGGAVATCEDWTSKTRRGRVGGPTATGGQIPVGHSWPRSNAEGRHWISEHTVNGCEPGVNIAGGTAAPRDDFRVGAAGGYGGIYCFALGAAPPSPADAQ